MKYIVKREHEGDKFYNVDDVRELDEATALQLVRLGVLAPIEAKPESAPQNKATKPEKTK